MDIKTQISFCGGLLCLNKRKKAGGKEGGLRERKDGGVALFIID